MYIVQNLSAVPATQVAATGRSLKLCNSSIGYIAKSHLSQEQRVGAKRRGERTEGRREKGRSGHTDCFRVSTTMVVS